ncbi:MAG: 23S rRNA (guanosine(2251)-2'-O)-methyltransferase RlmB [Candidatus Dormibacteria bacterium]
MAPALMPEILFGRNPVLEALRAGRRLRRLLLAPGMGEDPRLAEIRRTADDQGVVAETQSRSRLSDIAHSQHHQGIAAYFDGRQLDGVSALEQLVRAQDPAWPPLLLCLDQVQDPQNLGSLARSAESFGVTALVLPRHRTAPISAAVAKSSSGAIEHLRLVRVANLVQTLERLRQLGLTVVGLDVAAAQRADQIDLRQPLALVVGAEGSGLRQLTRRTCDALAALPIGGRVGSLNAGVAGAVILYEAARQRGFAFPSSARSA